MPIEPLLACLEARAPYLSVGRPLLMEAGFAIHQGLPKTIKAATGAKPDPVRDQKLAKSLTEHLVAGEKLIRIVKLNRGEHAKLMTWISVKRKTTNALTTPFPGIAEPRVAAMSATLPPTSLGAVILEDGAAALYTVIRAYEERVQVPVSDLKAGAAVGYAKLIGIRRSYRQTHEAIWAPSAGDYACLCTDFPRGVPKAFTNYSQAFLLNQVALALGRKPDLYNLWPAVDGLYNAPDGKLVDYGFVVAGEQVNHHKARRNGQCLRKTVYDAAGAQAVGSDLELFKVAMQWTTKVSTGLAAEPEVLLPGMAADLHRVARLDHAILRDAMDSTNLAFVINKLRPFAK